MSRCHTDRGVLGWVLLPFLVLALYGQVVGVTCVPPPPGIVSWWSGNGDATDFADGNDGALRGASFASGKVDQAFSFDGAGEVLVPGSPNLNVQQLTITAWVLPTLLDAEDTEIILNKEPESGFDLALTQYELGIKSADAPIDDLIPRGNLTFYIGGIHGLPDEYSFWVNGGGAVPLNTWTHVVLTFDGTAAKVYIDGVMTRSITELSGSVGASSSPVKIGARSDAEVGFRPYDRCNGLIDEVAIYGRALDAAEIQVIFEAGSAGLCKPCDADGNGIINLDDALAVIKLLRTEEPLHGNGDCHQDGMVNFRDVLAILQALGTQ